MRVNWMVFSGRPHLTIFDPPINAHKIPYFLYLLLLGLQNCFPSSKLTMFLSVCVFPVHATAFFGSNYIDSYDSSNTNNNVVNLPIIEGPSNTMFFSRPVLPVFTYPSTTVTALQPPNNICPHIQMHKTSKLWRQDLHKNIMNFVFFLPLFFPILFT